MLLKWGSILPMSLLISDIITDIINIISLYFKASVMTFGLGKMIVNDNYHVKYL